MCLKHFGIPSNHPTWSAAPSEVKPVDPPQAYSPLVLPSFNGEELLEEMANEDPKKSLEVAGNLGQDAANASATAESGSNTDVSPDL